MFAAVAPAAVAVRVQPGAGCPVAGACDSLSTVSGFAAGSRRSLQGLLSADHPADLTESAWWTDRGRATGSRVGPVRGFFRATMRAFVLKREARADISTGGV